MVVTPRCRIAWMVAVIGCGNPRDDVPAAAPPPPPPRDAGLPPNGTGVVLVGSIAAFDKQYDIAGDTIVAGAEDAIVALDPSGRERWRTRIAGDTAKTGPGAITSDREGRVLVAYTWAFQQIGIGDRELPKQGFDVFRLDARHAEVLPGSFGGVVSSIAVAGDDIVAAGGAIGKPFVDPPLKPWHILDAPACAATGPAVIARWHADRPDWLRCLRGGEGFSTVTRARWLPDGDIVAIVNLSGEGWLEAGGKRFPTDAATREPSYQGWRCVLLRLDGATGAIEWAFQPIGRTCVDAFGVSGGIALSIDDAAWLLDSTDPSRTAPRPLGRGGRVAIARGVRGGVVVASATTGDVAEIDPTSNARLWQYAFPADTDLGAIATGTDLVAVRYRARRGGTWRIAVLAAQR